MDVAHLTSLSDVSFRLPKTDVAGAGPMLGAVLYGTSGVIMTCESKELRVLVGVTMQVKMDLHYPSLRQKRGMVITAISITVTIITTIAMVV